MDIMDYKFMYKISFDINKLGQQLYDFSFTFRDVKPELMQTSQQDWVELEISLSDFLKYREDLAQLLAKITERERLSRRDLIKWLKAQCKDFGKQLYKNKSLGNMDPMEIAACVWILKEIGGIPNDDYVPIPFSLLSIWSVQFQQSERLFHFSKFYLYTVFKGVSIITEKTDWKKFIKIGNISLNLADKTHLLRALCGAFLRNPA